VRQIAIDFAVASDPTRANPPRLSRSFLKQRRIAWKAPPEVKTQMILAGRLNSLSGPTLTEFLIQILEIRRMFAGFKHAIENRIRSHGDSEIPLTPVPYSLTPSLSHASLPI